MTLAFFNPPLIAHRGASALSPENTMVAFKKAQELGVTWIEFDVMLAKCGTPIIFHDESLDRTTNGSGSVADYTFDDLQTLDAGGWFGSDYQDCRIPAFSEVLEWLAAEGMSANIEVKPLPGQDAITAVSVLEALLPYQGSLNSNVIISSFSVESLKCLHESAASWQLGLLMHEWRSDWWQLVSELECVSVHVNEAILTPDLIAEVKATGRRLLSYTVNSIERAEKFLDVGVDAIFSDLPQGFVEEILALKCGQ